MSITRRRRGEKRNHKKSRKMRGGDLPGSSYISSAKDHAQEQFGQAASAVYGRVKDVSNTATKAIEEQATKILDTLKNQATELINELKEQVNTITDAALAKLKIQASAAAKQAVAEALVAVKSQIKMG
jgi:hypothetical protein